MGLGIDWDHDGHVSTGDYMIYFTSDLHLGHTSILHLQNRPFADIEEMNDAIIHNINDRARADDQLYILGDISHRVPAETANALIRRIHCRKYLILGNHDVAGSPPQCIYDTSLFQWVGNYLQMNVDGLELVMMHYPMLSWPKTTSGSVMLHGHIHSRPEYNEENHKAGIRRYDVGVDANDYRPVSFDEIRAWAESTPVSLQSRKNLYIPGVWQPEPISEEQFHAEHPDCPCP